MTRKKAQTSLFVLHQAIAKVREHYEEDVRRIMQQLLHDRDTNKFADADDAEHQLYEYVTSSDWMNDNHEGLVLYLSPNRDIADLVERTGDDDDVVHSVVLRRAIQAMEMDICKLLWFHGWLSIGKRYRLYPVTTEVRKAINEVLQHGRQVCDQLGADKERWADTAEAKLLNALDDLEHMLIK